MQGCLHLHCLRHVMRPLSALGAARRLVLLAHPLLPRLAMVVAESVVERVHQQLHPPYKPVAAAVEM